MPFSWTINPYRGCTHGCVYCFARNSHTYLEFDSGRDFDTQIVVKTNVAQVLRQELGAPRWAREHVAMGTNTDPYQRAEGRYRLMPGVIAALADSGTPFSILTKGTVLSRDLELLAAANRSVSVGIGVSLALLDPELQSTLEPGTPTPRARVELVRRIRAAGLPCGVFIAPLLPLLTDTDEQVAALVGELKDAGATGVTGIGLHLRPGAREWFFRWLGEHRPDLVASTSGCTRAGANLPKDYRAEIVARVRRHVAAAGIGSGGPTGGHPGRARATRKPASRPGACPVTAGRAGREPVQPALF